MKLYFILILVFISQYGAAVGTLSSTGRKLVSKHGKSGIAWIVQWVSAQDREEITITTKMNKFVAEFLPMRRIKFTDDFTSQVADILGEVGDSDRPGEQLLFATGNLQEIIWRLRESGASGKAERLEELLTDILERGEIDRIEDINSGSTKPQLVTFKNGLRGVFKTRYHAEGVAMSRFDKLLTTNVFPLTVTRKIGEQEGSIQLFIENSTNVVELVRGKWDFEGIKGNSVEVSKSKFMETGELSTRRIYALAKLTNDTDAHGNLLVPAFGRRLLIDGGSSFYPYPQPFPFRKKNDLAAELAGDEQLYYIHPDFIARMQDINNDDLRYVLQPLEDFFTDKEELEILRRFAAAIRSEVYFEAIPEAFTQNTGQLVGMVNDLRRLYTRNGLEKYEDCCYRMSYRLSEVEEGVSGVDQVVLGRVDYYRTLLLLPDFLRTSIDEYTQVATHLLSIL